MIMVYRCLTYLNLDLAFVYIFLYLSLRMEKQQQQQFLKRSAVSDISFHK